MWKFYTKEGAEKSVSGTQSDRGTVFPTSPADGQEYTYIVDATNGIDWRFKYNAGSASAYKWEFVGGSDVVMESAPSLALSGGAYTEDTASRFTLPRAGDYSMTGIAYIQGGSGGASNTFAAVGVAGSVSGQIAGQYAAVATANMTVPFTKKATGVAASTVVSVFANPGGTAGVLNFSRLIVRPIRVS